MKRSLLLLVNILLTITSMAWEGKTTIGGINYGLQYFPTDQVYWAYMSGGNVEGDIVIPDSIYFEGYLWTDAVGDGLEVKHNFAVVRINKNAFKDNTSLKSIRGGRNLQVIEESAFEGCINLSNVTLSNLTTKINTKAFYGCTSLTSIILPFYLGGKDQFSGCDNLKDIYVNYKIPFLLDSPFNSLSDDVDFIYKNARLHVPKGSVERYKKEEIWNKFQTITGDVELSPGDVIDFVDPATEALCLLNWDTNKDGRLQKTEARAVKTLGTVFKNQSGIQMFEELEYFTGLTTINDEAFMGDTKLYTPVLPENVTSIGNSAFEGCGIIRKIEFPNGITSIGDKAFKSVTLFESTLPDGLKSIGEEAFANCLNLSDVVIPVSVTTIKSGAFNGCQFNNLYVYWKEPFAVDESTFYTTRLSNYVYNHCKLHVPYGTTAKYQATEGWKNFLNIVEEKYEAQENSEPYVVYNDGTLTFYYDGLRSSRAGTTYDLNGVQSLPQWTNIAESITKAVFDPSFSNARPKTTRNWFMNQTNLVDIQGLNYLNTSEATNMVQMFGNCSSLANLDLSQFDTRNVTSMQQMFVGCSKLTSIDLSQFDTGNVKQMGAMFRDCSSLMNLDISNFNTSNVTRMAAMFMGCSGLTNLDISNFNTSNVTDMGSMFWGCSGLTSLDLSNFNTNNVTDMGLMFSGCSGLTSLNVSNFNTSNVTDMWGMFSGCSGLTSLDVSNFNTDNVTQMWNMFNDCSGLTSLDVSKFNTGKVTNISNMFSGCSGLTSLDVSNFNTNNVTNMSQMFWGCSCLTSLDVSNVNTHNVTDMGRLFYLCKELANLTMGSQFITDESTKIDYIFTGCSKLSKVTFNGDVPASIKSNFFSGVGKSTAPATLEVPEQYKANYQAKFTDDQFFGGYFTLGTIKDGDTFTVKTKEGVDMTFKIISTEDKTCQVGNGEEASVDTATPGQVTIPSVANGYDVIAIGDKGFYNCANLTHIWLHEGIKTIGELAFYGCTSLRVLDIPHSITTIADNAFNGCPNVTIRIPVDKVDVIPVKSIGNDVIIEVKEPEPSTQSEIERIFIPKPVQSIGEKAFSNCPSVKIMEVDEENAVFDSRNACNAIIRTADNTLLFGCQNTKIPSTVTAIAQYAFEGHAKLQQIEIPAGVASIGESAFSGCTDLESVTTKIVEPFAINDNTFDEETYKTATLYVPYGTRATYKTTDGWKNFFNIEELPNSTEGEPYVVYYEGTLTFYCDEKRDERQGSTYDLNTEQAPPKWNENKEAITKAVFDNSFASARPVVTSYWFWECNSLQSIDGLANLNTSEVTDMYSMFQGCSSLTSLDLSHFDTKKVTSMGQMFYGCNSLNGLDLSSFNTSNVTYMGFMFFLCSNLSSLNVSSFDTKNVTGMRMMFGACRNLTSLDVSGFDVQSATDLSEMFANCSGLTTLDVSKFNTANAVTMGYMFRGCEKLTSLNLGSFSTKSAKDCEYETWTNYGVDGMFIGCTNLSEITFGSDFATDENLSCTEVFSGCNSLGKVIYSGNIPASICPTFFNGVGSEKVYAALNVPEGYMANYAAKFDGNMFYGGYFTLSSDCTPVGDAEPYAVLSSDNTVLTFYYDDKKESRGGMNIGPFTTTLDKTNMGWYEQRTKITSVVFDASFAKYTSLTSTSYWFNECENLKTISGIDNLKTDEVTNMAFMFFGCSSLSNLDVSGFNTANVTNMEWMFGNCSSLASLDVSGFNTEKVTDMYGMFYNCSGLTSLDVNKFNTSNVNTMGQLFDLCSNLTSIDISNFKTDKVTSMWGMFRGCTALKTIYVDEYNWSTANVKYSDVMFSNCNNLVGCNGTKYDPNHTNIEYARVDKAGAPGYLTLTALNAVEGDVDGDGKVTEEDIAKVKEVIFDPSFVYHPNMDVNRDGVINVADIVKLVKIIKSKAADKNKYDDETEGMDRTTFDEDDADAD